MVSILKHQSILSICPMLTNNFCNRRTNGCFTILFTLYIANPILLTIYKAKCTLFNNGEVFFFLFFSLYCIIFYKFATKSVNSVIL